MRENLQRVLLVWKGLEEWISEKYGHAHTDTHTHIYAHRLTLPKRNLSETETHKWLRQRQAPLCKKGVLETYVPTARVYIPRHKWCAEAMGGCVESHGCWQKKREGWEESVGGEGSEKTWSRRGRSERTSGRENEWKKVWRGNNLVGRQLSGEVVGGGETDRLTSSERCGLSDNLWRQKRLILRRTCLFFFYPFRTQL